jgi:hypothetical protein
MPKLVFQLEVPVTFRHLCFDIPSSFGNSIFVISTQASAYCILTPKPPRTWSSDSPTESQPSLTLGHWAE